MFEIRVRTRFSASHHLRGYPGDCARVHGHNWEVEARLEGPALDEMGMVADFRRLRRALDEVAARLDHRDLNGVPPFDQDNPTAENLARFFYRELTSSVGGFSGPELRLKKVTVFETPDTGAAYSE